MRIYDNAGNTVDLAGDQIGYFPSDTRKPDKLIDVRGDLSVKSSRIYAMRQPGHAPSLGNRRSTDLLSDDLFAFPAKFPEPDILLKVFSHSFTLLSVPVRKYRTYKQMERRPFIIQKHTASDSIF
jgi:hypothetical protein